MESPIRCQWRGIQDETYQRYHDEEWGVPVHNDPSLFEAMILDGFQAGLSWISILKKRENFRKAFDNFSAERISQYDRQKVEELMKNPGIIRNSLKINGAIKNANLFLVVEEEFGSFDAYIWGFVGGMTRKNGWESEDEIPTTSVESNRMSRDLKGRGFTFVGSTICYAFMQATGMVNDHITKCFRYGEV